MLIIFDVSAQANTSATPVSFESNELLRSMVVKQLDNTIAPVGRAESVYTGWELTGTDKDKKFTVKLVPKDNKYGFSIALTSPLEDGKNSYTLLDSKTDAFANATSFTVGMRNIGFLTNERERVALGQKILAICRAKFDAIKIAGTSLTKQEDCYARSLQDLVSNADFNALDDSEKENLRDFISAKTIMLLYGATATIAHKKFDYFTGTGIDSKDSTKSPWGASMFASLAFLDNLTVTLTYEYQKGFEAGSKITRCLNSSEQSYFDCAIKEAGAPQEDINRNIKVGFKTYIETKNSFGFNIGFAPEYTHETEDSEEAYSLPIFLFSEQNSGLTGGIKFDKKPKPDGSGNEEVLGIFVGGKFSLL